MRLVRLLFGVYFFLALLHPTHAVPVHQLNAQVYHLNQPPSLRFEHLSTEHGLSQAVINDITQDNQGFLWFATQYGLNRYDGYEFRVYLRESDDPNSLISNGINVLFVDSRGILWVGSNDGLMRYNPKQDNFISYQHQSGNPNSLTSNYIKAIAEDNSGKLWIGTSRNGLNRFDPQTANVTRFALNTTANVNPADNIIEQLVVSQHNLWIATSKNGISRLNITSNNIEHYIHQPEDKNSLISNAISTLYRDQAGDIWIGSSHTGLSRYNKLTNNFSHYAPVNNTTSGKNHPHNHYVTSIQQQDNNLWFGTSNHGLFKFDINTNQFEQYTHRPLNPNSLSSNNITHLLIDNSGTFWIGTFAAGLNKHDPATKVFKHFYREKNNPNTMVQNNLIWSLFEDSQQDIWIGSQDGALSRYSAKNQTYRLYRHNPNDPNSISSNTVLKSFEDNSGQLWFGTSNQGLNRFDRNSQTFSRYLHSPTDQNSLSSNRLVSAIAQDKHGHLWVGSAYGLNKIDLNNNQITRYFHDSNDPNSLGASRIEALYTDQQKRLWIATYNGGLNLFNDRTQRFIRFNHNPNDPHSLPHDIVHDIKQDNQGIYWVGSDNGLSRFDPSSQKFTNFNHRHGLSNDSVLGIIIDQANKLWLTTNKGLNHFDPSSEKFTVFNQTDGLGQSEYAAGAHTITKNGDILVGGINGFNQFNPKDLLTHTTNAPLVLTRLLLNNQEITPGHRVLPKAINHSNSLNLNYNDRVFAIEFVALQFSNPQKQQYAYKLEGFNQDWLYTSANNRRVTYTNLDAGNYVFKVKSHRLDRAQNKSERSLNISIKPAPWRTWWAYSLYVGIISLIIGTFIYLQLRKLAAERQTALVLRQSNETLEQKVTARTAQLQTSLAQLKATQAQLVEAEKMAALGSLVAGVAHEVNTPLGICITTISVQIDKLQTLANRFNQGQMTRSHFNEFLSLSEQNHTLVERNLNRAAELIQSFKKVAVNQLEDNIQQINFHHYLRDIIASAQPKAKQNSIEINLTSRGDWTITTWPGAWWQIISSLIENSLIHGFANQPQGRIEISAKLIDNALTLCYQDDGQGMNQNTLNQIFDPFYTTNRNRGSIGLGMHIVYNMVVQKLNGTIDCQSQPNQGISCFINIELKK